MLQSKHLERRIIAIRYLLGKRTIRGKQVKNMEDIESNYKCHLAASRKAEIWMSITKPNQKNKK